MTAGIEERCCKILMTGFRLPLFARHDGWDEVVWSMAFVCRFTTTAQLCYNDVHHCFPVRFHAESERCKSQIEVSCRFSEKAIMLMKAPFIFHDVGTPAIF